MKEKDTTISFLRVVATILVVIGHCSFYVINTGYPEIGIDWTMEIRDSSLFYKFANAIVMLIYTCHMQLFIFISGYVYRICIAAGKYKESGDFLKKKFNRLIIPYLLVTLFYNIPILMYSGYFSNEHQIFNIFLYFVGYGKNHLWFLITLFEIFLVSRLSMLIFHKKLFNIVTAVVLFYISQGNFIKVTSFLYVDRFCQYWIWFELGSVAFGFWKHFNKLTKINALIMCASTGLGWIVFFVMSKRLPFTGVKVMCTMFGVVFMFLLGTIIDRYYRKLTSCSGFRFFDKYSMDIYLYGVPINYLLITTILNFESVIVLNNITSFLLFGLRFILQIVIAVIISNVIKCCKNVFGGKEQKRT